MKIIYKTQHQRGPERDNGQNPLKSRARKFARIHVSFNIVPEVLDGAVRGGKQQQRRRRQGVRIGQEEAKLALLADDMIVLLVNPK